MTNVLCGTCYQASVLESLKAAQEKYGDSDGLRLSESLIENLYREHDELDREDLGESFDASDGSSDGEDDDEDINLDEISDDSGHNSFIVL